MAATNAAKCHQRRRNARKPARRIRTGHVTGVVPRTLNTFAIAVSAPLRCDSITRRNESSTFWMWRVRADADEHEGHGRGGRQRGRCREVQLRVVEERVLPAGRCRHRGAHPTGTDGSVQLVAGSGRSSSWIVRWMALGLASMALVGCGRSGSQGQGPSNAIAVASFNFPESELLGQTSTVRRCRQAGFPVPWRSASGHCGSSWSPRSRGDSSGWYPSTRDAPSRTRRGAVGQRPPGATTQHPRSARCGARPARLAVLDGAPAEDAQRRRRHASHRGTPAPLLDQRPRSRGLGAHVRRPTRMPHTTTLPAGPEGALRAHVLARSSRSTPAARSPARRSPRVRWTWRCCSRPIRRSPHAIS